MSGWRFALVGMVALLAGPPLVCCFRELSWPSWDTETLGRFASLASNTCLLVLGTVLFAVPLGGLVGLLLFRSDLPGRGWVGVAMLLSLCIPLAILTSAWEATLGVTGWLPLWPARASQPWSRGLLPAIWVHGLAALPWSVLLIGAASRWVERELEEDALLVCARWRVVWLVTLPRCRPALLAAVLVIAVQTAGEITVSDMFEVRTFAEEVYLVFNVGGRATPDAADVSPLGEALALALPGIGLLWLLGLLAGPLLLRALTPPAASVQPPLRFALGRARGAALVGVLLLLAVQLGVPLGSLCWKLGATTAAESWSLTQAIEQIAKLWRVNGVLVLRNFGETALTALLLTGFAFLLCWSLLEAPRWQFVVFATLVLLWVVPGPVLGLGLKEVILRFARWSSWLGRLLYYEPSPVPTAWGQTLRALPYASALLWPLLRSLPHSWREALRLDGGSALSELRHLYVPLYWRGCLWVSLVVFALCFAETSVSRLVQTPGWDSVTGVIFDRMHYGVSADVAALGLVPVGLIALVLVALRADRLFA